jgi:hypothetical protein
MLAQWLVEQGHLATFAPGVLWCSRVAKQAMPPLWQKQNAQNAGGLWVVPS